MYLVRTQQHGEPNVPVCLLSRAEDSEIVDGVAFAEEHGGGEGGAEGSQFGGVYQTCRAAASVHEGK